LEAKFLVWCCRCSGGCHRRCHRGREMAANVDWPLGGHLCVLHRAGPAAVSTDPNQLCFVVDQRSRTTSGSMILARLWSRANPLGPEAAFLGFRLRTWACVTYPRDTSKITSCNDGRPSWTVPHHARDPCPAIVAFLVASSCDIVVTYP